MLGWVEHRSKKNNASSLFTIINQYNHTLIFFVTWILLFWVVVATKIDAIHASKWCMCKKSSNTKISLLVWPTCSQKHMIPGRELQYTNLHTIDSFQTCMFHTHYQRIQLGITMLPTMCFQFWMLNIYRPYGCHLKSRSIMWWSACSLILSHLCYTTS